LGATGAALRALCCRRMLLTPTFFAAINQGVNQPIRESGLGNVRKIDNDGGDL
jgi:hypothetical protein